MNPAQLIIGITIIVIVVGLLVYFTTPPSILKGERPAVGPVHRTDPTPQRTVIQEAMWIAAHEVFDDDTERLNYTALRDRLVDARGCSVGAAEGKIERMMRAGAIIRHSDNLFSRSLES